LPSLWLHLNDSSTQGSEDIALGSVISHQQAMRLANEHLRAEDSPWVANHATRDSRYGVWIVSYRDPAEPDVMLDGGGLVVTDEGDVHNLSSVPESLEDVMMDLSHGHDATHGSMFEREGQSRASLEAPDPEEAAGLAAWKASMPWPDVLGVETSKPYFDDLMRFLAQERAKHQVYPAPRDVFAAFDLTSHRDVRVVILGQDPYPNPGQANGLCFSVPRDVRMPRSLVNIHAAMRFDELIPPDHGDLSGWATQGVFLLNTALTVPRSGAGDHVSAWRPFTDAVIRLVSDRDGSRIVFLLWGAEAQKKKRLIDTDRHAVIEAPHPSARGEAQVRFRESQIFSRANQMLREFDSEPIEWSIA
jgi:uracil-DNA glycosylase